MEIRLDPLTSESFSAFEELLGSDAFGGCFCAVWTAFGSDWARRCADSARPNLAETRRRVEAAEHVGFLVRNAAGSVVAWTGAGPKSGFPAMATRLGARLTPLADDVWAVGCLAIAPTHRGGGLSSEIVAALIERARSSGARAIEAFPTRPWDEPRSYRGSERVYAALGFVEQGAERDGDSEILLLRRELT